MGDIMLQNNEVSGKSNSSTHSIAGIIETDWPNQSGIYTQTLLDNLE
jgi:hypothetical protein